jgi:hypothetical protein
MTVAMWRKFAESYLEALEAAGRGSRAAADRVRNLR